ncbi:Methionine--tRNA ligase like protein [Argiope bruennichi]|uniref:Methionine--tRNA ligase, cytoplasmic n=1 Tax=Argiope bruennichi TaxID=94029 RepID=A0A8T0ES28_ARGBR|nr:Methionine--tRNA ligase like protein [Argiope bruennichi]
MLKLYTDSSCNIGSLKILATAEFFSTKVEVIRSSDSKTSVTFPVLEVSDGSSFFSSNASCRYIQSLNNAISSDIDAWLEWESTVLQPSVCALLKAAKVEGASLLLKRSLSYLNAVLAQQNYLSGKNSLGLADIVIWANLHPLLKASFLPDVSEFSHLQKWLTGLKTQSPLCKAFSIVSEDAKPENLKKKLVCHSLLSSEHSKFFMPVHIPDFNDHANESVGDNQEASKEVDVTEAEIAHAYAAWVKGKSSFPSPKSNKGPILPKKDERNILVTSALPYVNNIPHLGNIIGSVLSADVFARYCRVRGYNTLYICGTDEYGTATETKAISLGVTPKEICDKYNKLHSEIYQWFNISFDHFGRTTTSKQTEIAQDIFNKLYAQNLVLVDTVEQLYCESCERFLADRFVEGICPLCQYEDARGDQCDKCGKLINAAELKKPQCKLCRATPHLRSSKHLFLDLPKLEEPLKQYLDKSISNGHWSNTAKVIANSWLKEGLKPRCITRDLKWGTPVPLVGFTDKVFYVWFDAPIGYLSITANYTDKWEHDNYTILNHLAATEYLNYEDVKFSKSRGVGVFGDDAKDTGLPSDVWRFYLLYLRPEAQDTYFSWNDLMLKINSELLNNLGNFVNRALSFISNNFDGCIPEMLLEEGDRKVIAQVDRELKSYIQCMEKTRLRDAIKYMLNISRIGNQARAGTVLGLSANICCLLCTLMEPYMPDSCASLKSQLNTQPVHHILVDNFVCLLPSGHKIGKPAPLFKKIEQELINELKAKYAGRQTPEKEKSPSKKPKETKPTENSVPNGVNPEEVASLESQVTEQGNKVRELKTNKASKPEIDKEVAVLLELKKKLVIARGENPDQAQGKSKNKKKR